MSDMSDQNKFTVSSSGQDLTYIKFIVVLLGISDAVVHVAWIRFTELGLCMTILVLSPDNQS